MSVAAEVERETRRRHAWLASLALAHLALLAPLIVGATLDDLQVLGINCWLKPMKFDASIAIYLGALSWYAPELGTERARRWPLALATAHNRATTAWGSCWG